MQKNVNNAEIATARPAMIPPTMAPIGVDLREGDKLPVALEIDEKGDDGRYDFVDDVDEEEIVVDVDEEEIVVGVSSNLKNIHKNAVQ
jgi:hypothetical protein